MNSENDKEDLDERKSSDLERHLFKYSKTVRFRNANFNIEEKEVEFSRISHKKFLHHLKTLNTGYKSKTFAGSSEHRLDFESKSRTHFEYIPSNPIQHQTSAPVYLLPEDKKRCETRKYTMKEKSENGFKSSILEKTEAGSSQIIETIEQVPSISKQTVYSKVFDGMNGDYKTNSSILSRSRTSYRKKDYYTIEIDFDDKPSIVLESDAGVRAAASDHHTRRRGREALEV